MLAFWTEWADIAGAVVHQAVTDHLVLAFEPFAAFGTGAACHWAVVRSTLAVHILVRANEDISAGGQTQIGIALKCTLANTASGKFQLCSLGRHIYTAQVS